LSDAGVTGSCYRVLPFLPHEAMLALYTLSSWSICPSVYLSVISRYCTKMVKRRITQTRPYGSPGTLVFWCQRLLQNFDGLTPNRGTKYRWCRL